MSAELDHRCDDNSYHQADVCYCQECLDAIKETSYNEGYAQGKEDAKE